MGTINKRGPQIIEAENELKALQGYVKGNYPELPHNSLYVHLGEDDAIIGTIDSKSFWVHEYKEDN